MVGLFPAFLAIALGIGWSSWLGSREGASPWLLRWPRIVGALFALCILGGLMGTWAVLSMPPPPVGEPLPDPPREAMLLPLSERLSMALAVGGWAWLIVMSLQHYRKDA